MQITKNVDEPAVAAETVPARPSTQQEPTSLLMRMLESAADSGRSSAGSNIVRADVVDVLPSGEILVRTSDTGRSIRCDLLETSADNGLELGAGDRVLVMSPGEGDPGGVVLGRIGRYRAPNKGRQPSAEPQEHVRIEAAETLALKCGESSVELRKDGKLVIRGGDMLLRAKRTQRIKGGSVAIN